MKRILIMVVITLAIAELVHGQLTECDTTLWQHVYSAERLKIIQPCAAARGMVAASTPESDGDTHIALIPDSAYRWMLNGTNSFFGGGLVCEPVCSQPDVESYSSSACLNFQSIVYIPSVGEHVEVVGAYVLDTVPGWNELHPVTSITILGTTDILDRDTTFLNNLKVYPQPANVFENIVFNHPPHRTTYISVYSTNGEGVGDYQLSETSRIEINTCKMAMGDYIFTIYQDRGILRSGKFSVLH